MLLSGTRPRLLVAAAAGLLLLLGSIDSLGIVAAAAGLLLLLGSIDSVVMPLVVLWCLMLSLVLPVRSVGRWVRWPSGGATF